MGLINEFKEFIVKGNAIDLAVGLIVGAAFGAVVNSLVTDVIMPPVGALMGGVDFSSLSYEILKGVPAGETHPITQLEVKENIPPVVIGYGKFINALIALVIQGFAIFMVVKLINKLKRKADDAPAPAAPAADIQLLTEIRDLLKK